MRWTIPNEREQELARQRGMDPGRVVVNRVGSDYVVILDLRTRKEMIVRTKKEVAYG